MVVLVTDRPDSNSDLALRLLRLATTVVVAPHRLDTVSQPMAAIVLDLNFAIAIEVDLVRSFLRRRPHTPVICNARDKTRRTAVQAHALGGTTEIRVVDSEEAVETALIELFALSPSDRTNVARSARETEQALGSLFHDVASDRTVDLAPADRASASVLSAIETDGIDAWLDIVWSYDNLTYQHCLLVTGLASAFALSLGFRAKDSLSLTKAALLHDVGKARIPITILQKPGALTPAEIAVMRSHVVIGYDALRASGNCDAYILDVVRHHHEMLDGSGYPDGLRGGEISDLVRLVTICDIFAALIERRSYKEPLPPEKAYGIISGMAGKLEPALLNAFRPIALACQVEHAEAV